MSEFIWILRAFPPLRGRSGASSGPRWVRRLIWNFAREGGQGDAPLGLPPPLGESGGHSHNNRGLPNNSKIKDFNRAKKTASEPPRGRLFGGGDIYRFLGRYNKEKSHGTIHKKIIPRRVDTSGWAPSFLRFNEYSIWRLSGLVGRAADL